MSECPKRGTVIQNLSQVQIKSANEALELLIIGANNRIVGATDYNHASSRSHAVMQLTLIKKSKKQPELNSEVKLTMIDLAGSERRQRSAKTQIEGANINKSLLALGTCIAAIIRAQSEISTAKKMQMRLHIPYRDSKLTRVLKESLIDPQCNILMIMCLNPHPSVFDETFHTVAFANKIRTLKVEHKNRVNLF